MGSPWKLVAAVAAGTAAALMPAAAGQAATPQLVIANASLTNGGGSSAELVVVGTVTCSAPSGQATVSLNAIQVVGGIGNASGSTTVACADGPVQWRARLRAINMHPGFANILGRSSRDGVTEAMVSQPVTL